jgi:hypothetical protein
MYLKHIKGVFFSSGMLKRRRDKAGIRVRLKFVRGFMSSSNFTG